MALSSSLNNHLPFQDQTHLSRGAPVPCLRELQGTLVLPVRVPTGVGKSRTKPPFGPSHCPPAPTHTRTLYPRSLGRSLAEQWTFWLIPLPRRPTRNLPCLHPELLHRDPNLVTADIRGWVMLRGREGCRVHYRMFSDIPDLPLDGYGHTFRPTRTLENQKCPRRCRRSSG